jgi:hypothetical protein
MMFDWWVDMRPEASPEALALDACRNLPLLAQELEVVGVSERKRFDVGVLGCAESLAQVVASNL